MFTFLNIWEPLNIMCCQQVAGVAGLQSHADCDCSPEGSGPVCCRADQFLHRLVPDQTSMGQPAGAGEHGTEDHRGK